MDLRGVKASDDSFKTSMTSPAEACRVDFRSGLHAAVGSTVLPENFTGLFSSASGAGG